MKLLLGIISIFLLVSCATLPTDVQQLQNLLKDCRGRHAELQKECEEVSKDLDQCLELIGETIPEIDGT